MNIADYYPKLETFLLSLNGVKTDINEWNWKRFTVGGKPFCAFADEGKSNPYIVIKNTREFNELMRSAYKGLIKPAKDLNSTYWNAVTPDIDITYDVVKKMCSRGYRLVFEKLSDKEKQKILKSADK